MAWKDDFLYQRKMAEANARDRICLSPSATHGQASPTDTRGREARGFFTTIQSNEADGK
jgi:hypothetical protein